MDEAMKVAEAIAGMSLPSVMAGKEAVNTALETSLAEGVRFERRIFHSLFHGRSEGRHEGLRREAQAGVEAEVAGSCPGRGAACNAATQTRDRRKFSSLYGPGSAAHRSLRSRCAAPGTHSDS